MKLTSFLRIPAAAIVAVLFASCDKDFNEIGADIVGEDHFLFEKDDTFSIVANTVATGPVQSNNLPINPLGVYNNPALGRTIASFVTQLEVPVSSRNQLFMTYDTDPEVVSVTLYVPYFSTLESTATDGSHTYTLDSIYGPPTSAFKLEIFESEYFLRDFNYNDQDEQETQRYYSNQGGEIDYNPLLLNNGVTSENTEFAFSPDEHTETVTSANGSTSIKRTRPGMKLNLDNDFFADKIFNAPDGVLNSNNALKNYFRGLYFKVSNTTGSGQLAMLNFAEGVITVKYKEDKLDENFIVIEGERIDKEFKFNLAGNTVSLLEYEDLDPEYTAALAQPFNAEEGQEILALKGGEGSVAVIDLFGPDTDGNGVADELEEMRNNDWMINEASLTFYINKSAAYMGGTTVEPGRIYLYDVNNKRPIVDYFLDNSTGGLKNNKNIHGGIIERDANGHGVKYKIRLTNYMRNLVKEADSTNVRLGLSVTETISNITMGKQRNPNPVLNNFVPSASAMNPLGTFLYGSHPAVPEDKRLKLEIYYTKRKPTEN